ncbi:hypothetical protein IM33_16605 [Clostridioides difficile]|nr:hypothetical protein IM33_16605 [Clostridioides difficile]
MKSLKVVKKYLISYKLRSLAIIISMIFSIMLIVGTSVLRYTNNNLDLQTLKYKNGPYHVVFNGINKEQLNKIQSNRSIEHIGLQYLYNRTSKEEKQNIDIMSANNDYLLSGSKIKEGRLPKNKNEIVVEDWILKLLGLDFKLNQEITLRVNDNDGKYKEEKFFIVGILNDIASNKLYGRRNLYLNFKEKDSNETFAYIEFKQHVNIEKEIEKITTSINIPRENVHSQSDIISLENINNKINFNDLQFVIIISSICGLIIYGIFNISIYDRIKDYSILKAIGCNNYNIFKLVFIELIFMYIISIPIGIVFGLLGVFSINNISNKVNTNIIIHGTLVELKVIIPISIILISILFIGIVILFISVLLYKQIRKISIIDGINKRLSTANLEKSIISITTLRKFMKTYIALSFKNIFRNKKTFLIILLSLSICGITFIVLSYKLSIEKERGNYQNWELHSNSDFQIDVYNENKSKGISETYLNKLKKLDGIKDIDTCKLIPSKMILNEEDIKNQKYFDNLNLGVKDMYFNSYLDKDKNTNELILKNSLRGYNDSALNKLKRYTIKGDINIKAMKEHGDAILYIPQTNNESIGVLPQGESVVNIQPGDSVTIKFRENKVLDDKYYKLEDLNEKYLYKTFKIGAIVSYDYMYDGFERSSLSPNLILSEDTFESVTGVIDYYSINIDIKNGYNHKIIERNISKITSAGDNIRPRNLVQERANLESLYEKSKIYSKGINLVIFIIVVINIINNINYNIISRKDELSILRSMGLDEVKLKRMLLSEGLFYWLSSNIIIIFTSSILQRIIYNLLNISRIGIKFKINYIDYILIIFINLIVIILAIYFSTKKIKEVNLIDGIRAFDR